MVCQRFQSLSPAGLLIDDVEIGPDRIVITARCRAALAKCPDCGRQSKRVHSRYERRLLDLPSQGRAVQLRVAVRRFRCTELRLPAKHFCRADSTSTWPADQLGALSRLEAIVHHLGIALGGRPAAALARRLMMPVSKDTLLRVVRRHAARDSSPYASSASTTGRGSAGQRYGSIICDLERRRVVDLLPDREPATVEAWLSCHPEVASSRATAAAAMARLQPSAAPQAVQVADRWHLMENASAAFLEAVRRSMRRSAWRSAAP